MKHNILHFAVGEAPAIRSVENLFKSISQLLPGPVECGRVPGMDFLIYARIMPVSHVTPSWEFNDRIYYGPLLVCKLNTGGKGVVGLSDVEIEALRPMFKSCANRRVAHVLH